MNKLDEPLVTGVNVTAIYATDFTRAKAFYVDLLGLRELEQMSPGILLSAGEAQVYLEGGRERACSPGLSQATSSVCFATDSVRAAFERLQAADCPVIQDYFEAGPGFAMFRIADPDGNVIEFAGMP